MRKKVFIITGAIVLGLLAAGGIFWYRNLRGVGPAIGNPPQNIASVFANTNNSFSSDPAVNNTDFPLKLPDGFRIDLVAADLPNARVLQFDADGNLWVSQPSRGTVARLTLDAQGAVTKREAIFIGLDGPHGFAFDPDDKDVVYIAEEGRVLRTQISNPSTRTTLMTMPTDGGHSSRTLGVGLDKRLYVTIGSSCNVCREDNDKRAAMWVMNRDGSNQQLFASGLRNTVFFTWKGNQLWGTDMGRDLLGDDLPPDEVNVIASGKDYGWPFCYGQKIHDTKFDSSSAAATRCNNSTGTTIDLQAHSAPLGLAFVTDTSWPSEWQGDLIVAYHGSWNRSTPTGYKLVRHKFDESGTYQGVEDFVTGWLADGGALGRPVDVIFNGADLYISDDRAGVVYRVSPLVE